MSWITSALLRAHLRADVTVQTLSAPGGGANDRAIVAPRSLVRREVAVVTGRRQHMADHGDG